MRLAKYVLALFVQIFQSAEKEAFEAITLEFELIGSG